MSPYLPIHDKVCNCLQSAVVISETWVRQDGINLLSDGISLQMGSSWQSVQYRDLMYDKLVNQKLAVCIGIKAVELSY